MANASFVELAPGGTLSVTPDALQGLVPGTSSVQVAASGAGRLNVPAILRALDRYPYGCTEQITSRAMPLVYLNDVAIHAGLGDDPDIRGRVQKAIEGVLANQSSAGSFGLWSPGGEDMWLDSYVTDFLTRARQKGYAVPDESFDLALLNLKNRLAYAGDFESGGEEIAYALYVLASNGRASIGDLRYYAETKLDAFSTPLAKAQIGAALALYGDKGRAEAVFRAAVGDLSRRPDDKAGWRNDYGSTLRDGAAMLTLASETRTGIDLISLSSRVERERGSARYTSTQEDAWSLLAAHALIESLAEPELMVNGERAGRPALPRPRRGRPRRRAARRGKPRRPRRSRSASPCAACRSTRSRRAAISTRSPAATTRWRASRWTLPRSQQGARLVAVIDVTTTETQGARLIVDDPLPAGFEIDNPHLLAGGDVSALDWLNLAEQPAHVEFRADRFIAALDLSASAPTQFQFAYVVRATSPGSFAHPAALVEDMYRPERRARTAQTRVEVVGPLR